MNDQEIFNEIKKDAEKIEVPKELSPESMKTRLSGRPISFTEHPKRKKNVLKFLVPAAAAAAAFALVIFALRPGLSQNNGSADRTALNNAAATETADSEAKASDKPVMKAKGPRRDAGDLITVGRTDEAVFAYYSKMRDEYGAYKGTDAMIVAESAETGAAGTQTNGGGDRNGNGNGAMADAATGAAPSQATDHSDTNVMEEGVGESDIVKTDGKHIFRTSGNRISIISTEGEMQALDPIKLETEDKKNAYLRELYLENGLLVAIADIGDEDNIVMAAGDAMIDIAIPSYYWNSERETGVYFYDVKDPSAPKLLSSFVQDGNYQTSRLVDGRVILFTNKNQNYMEVDFAYPEAGGEKLSAEDVYLPKDPGGSEFIMSSISLDEPGKKIDSCMIMASWGVPYVTTDSIYIYSAGYDELKGLPTTKIARFSFKDGFFNAEGACTADGNINDDFAIQERNGHLFVLTTIWNRKSENMLTVYDGNLSEIANIGGIAPGEQVYAARFINDIIYFITYKNMDPLFAVDVKDPSNPVIVGSVDITGFSDYLHPWGEGRLLGIGYETDPKNGRMMGTKLVMFDVTDPSKPAILATKVLPDFYPWNLSYKEIFVDTRANMFGFCGYRENVTSFKAFSYNEQEKAFTEITELELPEYAIDTRGLRIGDTIYAVTENTIVNSKGEKLKFAESVDNGYYVYAD